MLSLCSLTQSDYFILLATEIESDMGPWCKIDKLGGNIFFVCLIDCKLETSVEQYCYQTQKPDNEAKQGRDVQIDEERIKEEEEGKEEKREEAGRERLDGMIWTPGSF